MKISRNCLVCNNSFTTYIKNQKHCSQKCSGISQSQKYRKNWVKITCETCGKILIKPNYYKDKHNYCSQECCKTDPNYHTRRIKKTTKTTRIGHEGKTFICPTCKKEFYRSFSYINTYKTIIYCSLKCRFNDPNLLVNCSYCNKQFHIETNIKENHQHFFCNRKCRDNWFKSKQHKEVMSRERFEFFKTEKGKQCKIKIIEKLAGHELYSPKPKYIPEFGHIIRSSWEYEAFKKLRDKGESNYIYEKSYRVLFDDGLIHVVRPDATYPNCIREIKGRVIGNSLRKYELLQKQYKIPVILLTKKSSRKQFSKYENTFTIQNIEDI